MAVIPWAPQYQNGTPPDGQCTDFNGQGMLLHWEAALQLRAFAAEYEEVWGVPFTISEAGRSVERQEYLYNGFINKLPGFYPAAVPRRSSHGEFTAVDINSWVYGGSAGTERHTWMVNRMLAYGWSWWLVGEPSNESWHVNYTFGLKTITADANGVYNITTLEEQEVMGAVDEIKDHVTKAVAAGVKEVKRATGRGDASVFWVEEWGKTYSISAGLAVHHRNSVEYQIALRQSGQEDELAIATSPYELVREFKVAGLSKFVPGDQPDLIRNAPAGTEFTRELPITWK